MYQTVLTLSSKKDKFSLPPFMKGDEEEIVFQCTVFLLSGIGYFHWLIRNYSLVLNSVQSHAIVPLILYCFPYFYSLNEGYSELPLALV